MCWCSIAPNRAVKLHPRLRECSLQTTRKPHFHCALWPMSLHVFIRNSFVNWSKYPIAELTFVVKAQLCSVKKLLRTVTGS